MPLVSASFGKPPLVQAEFVDNSTKIFQFCPNFLSAVGRAQNVGVDLCLECIALWGLVTSSVFLIFSGYFWVISCSKSPNFSLILRIGCSKSYPNELECYYSLKTIEISCSLLHQIAELTSPKRSYLNCWKFSSMLSIFSQLTEAYLGAQIVLLIWNSSSEFSCSVPELFRFKKLVLADWIL